MFSAMPSKDRARSPIWSRDFEPTRTEKSPRATACVARVSRLTLRVIEPTSTRAIVTAIRYTSRSIAAMATKTIQKTFAAPATLVEELVGDDLGEVVAFRIATLWPVFFSVSAALARVSR
jgi:hypothetical protein